MNLESTFRPQPRPAYLLVHESGPTRDGATAAVIDATRPHVGLEAFNHSTFRAGENGIDAVVTARTLPMMAGRRLVVVRDLEEGDDRFFAALVEYLEDPSPSTTLILNGSKFPKVVKGGKAWSAVVKKAVAAVGWVLDAKKSEDPVQFVVERAARLGKRMDARTANVLVEIVGRKLGPLEQEVDKLASFVGEAAEITSDDITTACSMVAEAVIFDLTTALVARDRNATLAALQHLASEGNDPRYVLAMVTWKMRSVALAAEAMQAGASDGNIAKAAGLRFDEVRRIKPVILAGVDEADAMMGRLAKANLDMNSHRAGDQRILERLVVDWLL
ncbi:MAG: DNA polymerase III subunit delta [Alphaproteobacteria bacterium]|nr:DNA polymerase III subunit delta [Alphaproteobacteria bacterium]